MPTLKRHKCRAPVEFHAFMNTGWVAGEVTTFDFTFGEKLLW
jgi:hypothetical protein